MNFQAISGLLVQALLWGPTFLFIKIAVHVFPPVMSANLRLIFGAFFTYLFCLWHRKKIWSVFKQHYSLIFMASLLNNAIPFTLCALGESYVNSSLAGVIEGLVPALTLIVSISFLKHFRPNFYQILSVIFGFAGILIIFFPTLNDGIPGNGLGVVALFLMALSFAMGFVFSEKKLTKIPYTTEVITLQMMIAAIILMPFTFLFESNVTIPINKSFYQALAAIVTLGITGTSIGWFNFYNLVRKYGANFASLSTYLCLVISLILGIFFLDEKITFWVLCGTSFIFLSMLCSSVTKKQTQHAKTPVVPNHAS